MNFMVIIKKNVTAWPFLTLHFEEKLQKTVTVPGPSAEKKGGKYSMVFWTYLWKPKFSKVEGGNIRGGGGCSV